MASTSYTHKTLHYLPLCLALLYTVVNALNVPIGDFGNYYYGAKFLLDGTWGAWVYDPASFNLHIHALGQRNFFLSYTAGPAISNFYVPFALLPVVWAKFIWNIANSALFILALYRVITYYQVQRIVWWFLPLVFYLPFRNNINEGQSYFLVFYLLVEGFLQFKKGNLWSMALLWALAIHLKITPAFVLGFLVMNKEFKAAAYVILSTLILLFISIPFVGIELTFTYITEILPRHFKGEINYTYAVSYQSMQVMLKTILVPDALDNSQAIYNDYSLYQRLLLMFKVAIALPAVMCTFYTKNNEIKFSIWLLCSLLVSGYGNTFSLIYLIVPIVFLWSQFAHTSTSRMLFLFFITITTFIPFYWFLDFPLLLRFPRLYMLIGLYILVLNLAHFRMTIVYVTIVLITYFLPVSSDERPQNYFITKNRPLLVYDISVLNNQLVVSYFDFIGPQTEYIPLDFMVNSVKETMVPSSKPYRREKYLVINDSLQLYLSDLNRGIGFNAIRFKIVDTQISNQ